jgi:hypothetical protein
MIQIGHGGPDDEIVASSCAQFASSSDINRTTVRQAGERVGERHLFQSTILVLDLAVEFDHAAGHPYAGFQFACMEGLSDVVIGSCR